MKHIQQETGARVHLKGIGSGGFNADPNAPDANEPLHVYIQ